MTRRTKAAAVICAGAVLVTGLAVAGHADDVIVLVPPTTTTTTPPTTTAVPTTTLPTTTTAPTTTTVTTTAVPTTTESPTTLPPTTEVPSSAPPTTKGRPPTTKANPKANPNAKGPTSIEVDISSQTLFLRKGGVLVRTLHVSTGSGRRFCNKGKCQTAHTPRGRFRIQRRIGGWHTGALGRMLNPLYFSGGYAIHGSGSVPRRPASHGCVRITVGAAFWLPKQVSNGTPVWIHD